MVGLTAAMKRAHDSSLAPADAASAVPAVDPGDIVEFVVDWLDPASTARACCVSRRWRVCASEPSVWKAHVLRRLLGADASLDHYKAAKIM